MIEFYPQIRLVHIAAVFASVGLFFLRGLGLFAGARWPRAWPVRLLAYTVDTTLLTAALMLSSIIRQYTFVHAWLTVKVVLLVVYVALGAFAFWGRAGRGARLACWLAALAVYGYIYTVARAHHPLGLLAGLR